MLLKKWVNKNKRQSIGNPLLVNSTMQNGLLDKLPTTHEAQAQARHLTMAPTPDATPQSTPSKDDIAREPHVASSAVQVSRPVSMVPSTFSGFTGASPDTGHDFEQDAVVQPLFTARSSPRNIREQSPTRRSAADVFPTPPRQYPAQGSKRSVSTLRAAFEERASKARTEGLGLVTKPQRSSSRGPNLVTSKWVPIGPMPAEAATLQSISLPLGHEEDVVLPAATDDYPTPVSIRPGPFVGNAPQPEADPHTPETTYTDEHASVGYDVSPWSAYTRPTSGSTRDSIVSYQQASIVSYRQASALSFQPISVPPSPAHALHFADKDRQAIAAQTQRDDDTFTEFDMSELTTNAPAYVNGKFDRDLYMDIGPSNAITPPHTSSTVSTTVPHNMLDKAASPPPPRMIRLGRSPASANEPTQPSDDSAAPTDIATSAMLGLESPPLTPPPIRQPKNVQRKPLTSIMNRSHPLASLDRPQTAKGTDDTARGHQSSSSVSSVSSNQKVLPTTPAELDTVDHITALGAQLEALSLKKFNLQKILSAHERVLGPGNPLVITLERRRQTREEVRVLQEQLDETKQTEHAVGLRLVRARRRMDQEDPSAIWVRRLMSRDPFEARNRY